MVTQETPRLFVSGRLFFSRFWNPLRCTWLCQSSAAQDMGRLLECLIFWPWILLLSIIFFLVLPFLQSWTISMSTRSALRSHVFSWPKLVTQFNCELLQSVSLLLLEWLNRPKYFFLLLLTRVSPIIQSAKFHLWDKSPTSILWALWFKQC